jgi:hypothetical protein
MFMLERYAAQAQECENFQSIAVIVGNAEQFGIGIKRQHRAHSIVTGGGEDELPERGLQDDAQ